ncbi:hypothetical protein EME01_38490 [Sinorhizobium meliloti]|nr:hypothetical protein EME01_38490 [Sinorhizobium meliloti]
MARYELVRGLAVVMLLIPLGEHVLFLRLEHGKFANLVEIAVETALSSSNGRQGIAGHEAPPLCVAGLRDGRPGLWVFIQDPTRLIDKCGESMIQGIQFHAVVKLEKEIGELKRL